MAVVPRSITQNTSFLTLASIAQKVISAGYFFVVTWVIGKDNTAAYFNIFAAIAIFTVIADAGLANVLTREIAKTPEKAARYLNTIFSAKLVLGGVAIALLFLSKEFLDYPTDNALLVAIAGITLFFDSLRSIFYAVLRAYKNIQYESLGLVVSQIATVILGGIALALHLPLFSLIAVFTITSAAHLLYAMFCVARCAEIRPRLEFNLQILKLIVPIATPFALAGLIAQLYSYQDAFLIKRFFDPAQGGEWARAYKAVFAFQFIPVSLGASIFPVMSSIVLEKKEKITEIVEKAYQYLLILSLPLMVGVSVLAQPIILRFAPRFDSSLPALTTLIWSLGFGFLWYVHGAVLNSTGRQARQTMLMFATLLLSVVGNIFLLPRFGIRGAAITAIVSNGFLWAIGYFVASREVRFPHVRLALHALRSGVAAVGMGILLIALERTAFPVLLLPVVGGIAYVIFLIVTQEISPQIIGSQFKKFMIRY
jgi:O-antigen/teichoic acid export membrane protein